MAEELALAERPTQSITRSKKVSGVVEKKAQATGARTKKGSSERRRTPTHELTAGERNKELGRRGEDAAARFLERHGYDIIARNWTCMAGEADIIARDDQAVVLVEVKTRSNCDKGLPSQAVTAEKRKRYEHIAELFLQDYEVEDVSVRFDVVAIVVAPPDRAIIRHYINAFVAS